MNPEQVLFFPTLVTERLVLRKICVKDTKSVFLLRSNERVNRFIKRVMITKMEEAEAHIQKIMKGLHEKDRFYWAISLKNETDLIGTICLWNLSADRKTAELGYELMPDFHGKGLMTEAAEAVLRFAFEEQGMSMVEAFTDQENAKSIALLDKLGFKLDPERIDPDNLSNAIYTLTHEKNKQH